MNLNEVSSNTCRLILSHQITSVVVGLPCHHHLTFAAVLFVVFYTYNTFICQTRICCFDEFHYFWHQVHIFNSSKVFFFWDLKGFFVLYLDRCVPLPLHGHIQQSHHITQWAVWLAWSVMTKDNQLSAWECCWLNIVCRWIESLFSHLLLTAS